MCDGRCCIQYVPRLRRKLEAKRQRVPPLSHHSDCDCFVCVLAADDRIAFANGFRAAAIAAFIDRDPKGA